ncbi:MULTISPECIES: FAD-binding oxidoreductase [Streptomyces]|uniref:FAD-binding oxidoreductase n=1 Tax=Streptomyces mirabilis TaxID=68239 RepID=A0ABU3UQT5_9ACTN|nr:MULTISPECIES: FAD-binding oxidoreductase [Streptomyces]MDU8996301.1 FAD-binding oxidoreductase [Streptomyces mirabilis]NMI59336.1 FAD-binding oxidoreductase [Streptomyces sp. RLA2-12]QDN58590.1 FAD-binding oxidoreductase [Streptomyces sp. S1D4-20]QDN68684.1 FAD-binding oxidoreductase [Streptomyces sp. S1D4-14]QDO51102.1 FAD-binding oxidoreductase [Streptomyces sp. RLB3-5]
MQRRTFIGGGAAALAAAATAACNAKGSGGKAAATDAADTSLRTATTSAGKSGTGSGVAAHAAANWTALAKDLDGSLVRPGDRSWSTAHQLYNTRFDSLKPTAVAYVAHADDIRTTMAYARAHNIPLSIRNGGHSYAGWSSGNGRLILDVSKLNTIRASANEAVVGAGSKLIDVYRALAAKGVTIPAGSCPTVGVSGLTLGGGHGVVSRAYGLTCDSLTQATLITADGKQVVANASENKDLFWALRGAGNGNFGVVTELRFKTHAAPQAVSAYMTWPWAKAAAVVKAWQEWGPSQPDEIWSSLHLENGSGTPTVSVAAFSLGTYGELQNAVDRLATRVGAPARSVSLRKHSYKESMEAYAGCSSFPTEAQCHLPGSTPGRSSQGALGRETYAARSDFFDRSISAAGIQTLLHQISSVRGGAGSIALTALGGAVNRVSPTATAFVHRRSRMLAQYIASWGAGGSGTTVQSWLTSAHSAMAPYASGAAYQNYTDATLTNWRKAYYGDAATRLATLKKQYDPNRFFTFPQSL